MLTAPAFAARAVPATHALAGWGMERTSSPGYQPELQLRRYSEELRREREREEGWAPPPAGATTGEQARKHGGGVRLNVGVDMHELEVIEPIPGAHTCACMSVGGAGGGAGGWRPDPAAPTPLLPLRAPPFPEHKRVRVEVQHVSAHVPMLLGQPSLLKRLNPLALRRKLVDAKRPTHRQARARSWAAGRCW